MSSAWPHGTSRLLAFGKGGCLCISWVEKRKVFAQAFFKRLAGCGTASHDLVRLRQTQEGRKGFLRKAFRRGLRFRSGRSWARATGTQDPSSGGAGARWAPFSADRVGVLRASGTRPGQTGAEAKTPTKSLPPEAFSTFLRLLEANKTLGRWSHLPVRSAQGVCHRQTAPHTLQAFSKA